MSNSIYWLWLANLRNITNHERHILIEKFRDIEAVYAAESYNSVEDISQKARAALLDKDISAAIAIAERTNRLGAKIVAYTDEEYPARMREVDDSPVVLYVKGEIPSDTMCGAVVGTRKCSEYGKQAAAYICRDLVRGGVTIVSGMAAGIDATAANAAMYYGGKTIAVLGSGLDVVYPKSNEPLMNMIIKNGAVITQFPPGTPPVGRNFPIRNRVIAAISDFGVVVEAPKKSGALITANVLRDYGRDLFAVPGDIFRESFSGANDLIKNGAMLVTRGADILYEMRDFYTSRDYTPENTQSRADNIDVADDDVPPVEAVEPPTNVEETSSKKSPQTPPEQPSEPTAEPQPEYELSGDEQAIVEAIKAGAHKADAIVSKTGISVNNIMRLLLQLELDGIVINTGSGMYEIG